MPSTVKFNNQSRFCTIKVCDIVSNRFLPLKTHRIVSQKIIPQFSFPKGSFFFAAPWLEGYSLCCRISCSLPPSKIKDFCHLPHQREALVRCKAAQYALHRRVYRSALLSVRHIGIWRRVAADISCLVRCVSLLPKPARYRSCGSIRQIGIYVLQYTAIASQINAAVPSACLSMLFLKRSSATYI